MKYKIPKNRHPDVVRDSDIYQGIPTLLGTDIPVHTIVHYYQNKGYSPEEILKAKDMLVVIGEADALRLIREAYHIPT